MIRRDSPSRAVALDLMLRTFMNSSDFNNMQSKNWEAIAKLIPGTSPQECARRFQELQSASGDLSPVGDYASLSAQGKPAPRGRPGSALSTVTGKSQRLAVSASACIEDKENDQQVKGFADKNTDQDIGKEGSTFSQVDQKKLGPDSYGPNMVIHVCDEAKNVKKDFTCPRDLLVSEMRYFAEYLSSDTQRWEEVDISVHCDVQIFEWLMCYVKRYCPGSQTRLTPNLEPGNVISILISSDFLKMDSLVSECVQFCHQNMSAIVATPCNMNCINDKLCTRMAELFTDLEIDAIKDRKDKFKSKLFCKKIEVLFECSKPAASLYRCQYCKCLLTKELQHKLKCTPSRMSIDRQGNVTYHHHRDPGWDVNEHILSLRAQLKSWREVYWHLWASVTSLTCSRCQQTFPCSLLAHCRFHPDPARFDHPPVAGQSAGMGTHSCCGQRVLRFDPLNQKTGCQVRDHIVILPKKDAKATSPLSSPVATVEDAPHCPEQSKTGRDDASILDILLERKDFMCIPPKTLEHERLQSVKLFKDEEALCGLDEEGIEVRVELQNIFPDDHLPLSSQIDNTRDRDALNSSSDADTSDDELGDEEINARVAKHRQKRLLRKMSSKSSMGREKPSSMTSADSTASSVGYRRTKWDPHRSLRFNQDNQREEDHKRNQLMVNHLAKLRVCTADKQDKAKTKEYAGGLFSRLEAQFRISSQISKPTTQVTLLRAKTRANQLRTT